MSKKVLGQIIETTQLTSIKGAMVNLPHLTQLTHLQFRRFAGCPVCNLHLHSFVADQQKLITQGIQEVVVFHSSQKSLLSHQADLPFPLIADPDKTLYKAFGVEASLMSLLNPKSWPAMMRGMFHHFGLPAWGESMIGLPADFLIDHTGRILAFKYGKHANDHWSVADVIALSNRK
jgi:peroxiredoxin